VRLELKKKKKASIVAEEMRGRGRDDCRTGKRKVELATSDGTEKKMREKEA